MIKTACLSISVLPETAETLSCRTHVLYNCDTYDRLWTKREQFCHAFNHMIIVNSNGIYLHVISEFFCLESAKKKTSMKF